MRNKNRESGKKKRRFRSEEGGASERNMEVNFVAWVHCGRLGISPWEKEEEASVWGENFVA